MDIPSARLAALLREAMTPQAVPSAKADPVKTALVKALVAPPAPSDALVRPAATPALPMLLPATAARAQQTASTEIMQAYLALAEPDSESAGDPASAATAATATRRPAEGDTAQRGLAPPLAKVEEGAVVRPATLPWLTLLSPAVSPPRRASIASATTARGQVAARPGDPALLEHRQMSVGLVSLAAGFLAAAILGFVLLVLR
ncbi:hypothetical protein BPNPMPFG_000245 [Mesorhizobium sp. AR07]|uniref:hypothetical protein n=1 Tax=Mesorhizobium sp. AR07 TaxID=2865838 RepID=UPI00215F40E8|nr:hypothetical protein [Mesorhizobium sp. AR07]UVK44786.1 hypothetical protein BPNPMPFG_000245 [Mesorhizobium sp. AR07]